MVPPKRTWAADEDQDQAENVVVLDTALRRSIHDAASGAAAHTVRDLLPDTTAATVRAAVMANPLPQGGKLPDFLPTNPIAWFHAVESQLEVSNVVDPKAKYTRLFNSLPSSVTSKFPDLWTRQVDDDSYRILKERILKCFTPSLESRVAQFLKPPGLNRSLPPDLMALVLQLLGKDDPKMFLLEVFIAKLPAYARSVVRSSGKTDFYDVGLFADVHGIQQSCSSPGLPNRQPTDSFSGTG